MTLLLAALLLDEVTVLEEGQRRALTVKEGAPRFERITSPESLGKLWSELHPDGKKECPKVDFEKSMVLLLMPGHAGGRGHWTNGCRLKVEPARTQEGTRVVTYAWLYPEVEPAGPPSTTLPYLIVKLDRSENPLRVIEKRKEFREEKQETVREFDALK